MLNRQIIQLLIQMSLYMLLSNASFAANLTLKEAESYALAQSPEIRALNAKRQALCQSAIAEGQLSDPKFLLNPLNLPVDTFDLGQEAMTQIQLGLQQNFPKGKSLFYQFLNKKNLSEAEFYNLQVMSLQIHQDVRIRWMDLYYWHQARRIIKAKRKIFQHLLETTESMLANNQAQQKDVIRAQLELTELDNRLIEVNQQIEIAQSQLARWIGKKHAKDAIPQTMPSWPLPPQKTNMLKTLKQHPELNADAARISAHRAEVKFAQQQYIPGLNVGVAYGFRQGRHFDNRKRPDLLSAQINIDLPLFPHNRQDRRLNASKANLSASMENQVSHYRQLRELLYVAYSSWIHLGKSARLYQSKLIPEAKQYAQATMSAYQNAQTDFPTLARAYLLELNTELAGLKTAVSREMERINLMYLQGQ